ncbi:hypothetical protein C2U70_11320 [Bradyrhizobium guangdongense]|uniref:hypothetical protein n=1 Tax=Bradyrhizobium guangdongense TaxID=1325090 RepID=UPI001127CA63|nr:hypothetical protein [Bradyrhizobium guangdongense]TPQ37305.1 hypothetical protein C2U70_11320 [Bradyrhizobium guangdongense]
MTDTTEHFVTTQNIRHFQGLLKTEAHPDKRNILLQLLAIELAKLPRSARREMRDPPGLG